VGDRGIGQDDAGGKMAQLLRGMPAGQAGRQVRRPSLASRFATLATRIAIACGDYRTFLLMTFLVIVWAVSGPFFDYSETWQLIINTATTVLTFLVVFLIQNTQNRDALAVHLKLDEIIASLEAADNALILAEDDDDEALAELKKKYEALLAETAGREVAEQPR
jgi:low affinity Fe/Cu permease